MLIYWMGIIIVRADRFRIRSCNRPKLCHGSCSWASSV